MRILFDHSVPAPLIQFLRHHDVVLAKTQGWERLVNGKLLTAAEQAGFDVLLTADKRMRYQQDFSRRSIALVVLGNAQWPVARKYVDRIVAAVDACAPGNFVEIEVPFS